MIVKKNIPNIIFIAPAVILVVIFVYIFSGWNVWTSLTDWRIIGRMGKFIGVQNYIELFTNDDTFRMCFFNTIKLMAIFIGLTIPLGIICAIFLDLGVKGKGIFRTIYLIPLSFSFVASATMWSWMFMPDKGSINTLLRMLNLHFLTLIL